MTISELIERAASVYAQGVEVTYIHPTLYVICIDEAFDGQSLETRHYIFCQRLGTKSEALVNILSNPIVQLELLSDSERRRDFAYLNDAGDGQHWIAAFNPLKWRHMTPSTPRSFEEEKIKAVHFYGYKGGQGRSTVLLALAKVLADVGFRILVVDADIEAPSLDAMLDVAASDARSTFMGLSEAPDDISPIVRAYVGSANSGQIDLLACRPASSLYDMDFAAFLLNASLDPRVLEQAIFKLRRHVSRMSGDESNKYDAVFFDHRTGLAPSVLPIMEAWPGSAVIFVRPDGMARHIQDSRLLDSLLSYDVEAPGAFVSFSLDPQKNMRTAREQHGKVIESLLEKISDALTQTASSVTGEPPDIDPAELERYWVFWSHDQTLTDGRQPAPSEMSLENRSALSQLRGVIGLSGAPRRPETKTLPATLSSSGSSDEGQFILTPDLAKLFSAESQYTYIFGRKGTGKTRLLTELCRQELGEPLLVANDSKEGGLQSAGPRFQQLLSSCNRNFETFWWVLLNGAVSCPSTYGEGLEDCLRKDIDSGNLTYSSADLISSLEKRLAATGRRRVFLIDGVETAVPAVDLRPFVESLFRFLAAVQFNRTLSTLLTLRLFLRSDLAKGASQNVEQQIEGHVIHLHWNKTTILNFALARIVSLPWFVQKFPDVCARIRDRFEEIARGALADEDAEAFLLEIFPKGLERNKVKATTFFATYFSDAGGGSDRSAAFYPRLFDGFLRTLAQKCQQEGLDELPDGRLPSPIVLEAYDQASREFISDVRIELHAFLNIESDDARNKDAVDNLIQGFSGLSTPFSVEEIIKELSARTGIATDKVRQALRSMQAIGIFETRYGYPGEWRTGRLYKAGLAMKYVRKKESPEVWAQGDLLAI